VLSTFDLLHLDAADLTTAAALPGSLRTLDALHLASVLRVGADAMLVYDRELGTVAADAGVRVISSRGVDAVG
jgi:predicted nucleic acid-binding protein